MKKNLQKNQLKKLFIVVIILSSSTLFAQFSTTPSTQTPTQKSEFWSKVRFGGGFGLSFGTYTNISVSPNAVYQVNPYFSAGLGLQYSYLKQKDFSTSNMYGGSIILLANPIETVQLSAELEELSVNVKFDNTLYKSQNFWSTALFLGAGYRMGNVTVGGRYNVLFNKDKNVYGSAFMPFVRAYF